ILSASTGLACAVRTADCVPILIADRRSGAVAAVHAGWRGVVGSVIECALRELARSQSEAPEWVAAIGPHISRAAFEVSDEVAHQLQQASPDPGVVDRSRARPHVDLRRIVRAKLLALGVEASWIDDVDGCTVSDARQFFSFRRDGAQSGRHLSAIVARGRQT
ncbi:MAG TPA: polyphenol oxidase family protein, partial [Polyangiaceae bacterium]|nr:polyphenol oxidase family protein [Polyangiaceae bacterium]